MLQRLAGVIADTLMGAGGRGEQVVRATQSLNPGMDLLMWAVTVTVVLHPV